MILNNGKSKRILVVAILLVAPMWIGAAPQESAPPTPNRLSVARNFLRNFYPELNEKGYFLNLRSSFFYDKPSDPFGGLLELTVRDLPEGDNRFLPCPPDAKVTRRLPTGGFIGGDCAEKGVPPQVYLSAGFHFDEKGHIVNFSAEGPATGNTTAKLAFRKAIGTSQDLTGAERIAALKRAGARFGPNDKEDFLKSDPLAKLENFLGRLQIISVEFAKFNRDDRSDFSDEMEWNVRAMASRTDGSATKYLLQYEQYDGKLVLLCDLSTFPCSVGEPQEKK